MKKSKVKKLFVSVMLFCIMAFVMACTLVYGAEPTAQNPRVLSFSMMNPPSHFLLNPETGPIVKWIEAVEKETNGRIKFKIYNAESLGKAKDQLNLVLTGIADATGFLQAYTPGFFPLTTIGELPFAAPGKTSDVQARALWELYKKGLLDKKYNELKVMSIDTTGGNELYTNKKINSLDDFKGARIAATGAVWVKAAKKLGASPIQLSVTDSYLGLQRGMIDIRAQSWAAGPSSKYYEVARYVIELDAITPTVGIVMNLNTWNSLPHDIQKIIDNINERFVGYISRGSEDGSIMGYQLYGEKIAKPLFKKKGVEIYQLPPQEVQKMHEALAPLWDEWVMDMESKGLNGKKVMREYLSILHKLGAKPVYMPAWK